MDPQQLERIFKEKRDELTSEIQKLATHNRRRNKIRGDFADHASVENYTHSINSQINRKRKEREKIDAALKQLRLDPENYGLCIECGNEIPLDRLTARPQTLHCVQCKTQKEQEQKQQAQQPAYNNAVV